MISANYNETMINKAHAIVLEARQHPANDRDAFCQEICGLTYEYLRRVGGAFKKPSARTIMNLGYELYVRDVGTGEFSRLEMNVRCDWNPANPRMNPSSMPVFVKQLSEISSPSE